MATKAKKAAKAKDTRGGLDFPDWVAKERAKAARSKSIDLHKVIAKYREAVQERAVAYDAANARDAHDEDWDALSDHYDTPIYRLEIQAEEALRRHHEPWDDENYSRGLVVDGAVVVYPSDDATQKANANTFIILPEELIAVDPDDDARTTMQLTKDETTIVEAWRNRGDGRDWRPPVIAGFKSPSTIQELVEIVRLFLEYNIDTCVDEFPPQANRLDLQGGFQDDEIGPTTILFVEGNYGKEHLDLLTPEEIELVAKHRAKKERQWRRNCARHEAEAKQKARLKVEVEEMGPVFEPADN